MGQDFDDIDCYLCHNCGGWASQGRVVWGAWMCTECVAIEYGYYDEYPDKRPRKPLIFPAKFKVKIEELESGL